MKPEKLSVGNKHIPLKKKKKKKSNYYSGCRKYGNMSLLQHVLRFSVVQLFCLKFEELLLSTCTFKETSFLPPRKCKPLLINTVT